MSIDSARMWNPTVLHVTHVTNELVESTAVYGGPPTCLEPLEESRIAVPGLGEFANLAAILP